MAEFQASVSLDQWWVRAAWANELLGAECAAMADAMAVPQVATGEEVVQAASAEVQDYEPGWVVAQEMLMHFKEMLVLHITAESVAEAQVPSACPTLDMAVAQYLIMVEST